MPERPSADIIAFPRKPPDRPRNAVADGGVSVEASRDPMANLHGSPSGYHAKSDGIGLDLASLGARAPD